MISKKSITLAAATILGLSAVSINSNAQHFGHSHGGGYGGGYSPVVANHSGIMLQLEQNVFLIDRLANDMAWRYGREVYRYRGCSCSQNLYKAMRVHTGLTANLVKAFRGNCKVTFKKAACSVRENLNKIQEIRKTAQVSNTVCALIRQSCPPSTFVHKNSHRWEAGPDLILLQKITQNINLIDRLSDEMVWRYGREVRNYRNCSCSLKLYAAMRTHTGLVDNLVRANRGTCKVTFKKAACAVRTNLNKIQQIRKTAQVSSTVCALIRQSCPPSTFVNDNSSKWAPMPVARGGSCGSGGSTYTTRSRSQSPFGFFLSRFGF